MTTNLKPNWRLNLAVFCFLIFLSACSTSKKLKYFQDLPDTSKVASIGASKFLDPVIEPDDILAINVNTTETEAGMIINARNGVNLSAGVNNQTGASGAGVGYLVDKNGDVEVPILGKVHLAGSTITQAKDKIREIASKSFKDPIVDVRFSNFKVTVIGEVNRPASYVIPNERVSLLDAIGYAGDMTVYGKRNNVLLMRRTADGKNLAMRLDITKKETINSPYFYLKQNDVIYVEPRRNRQTHDTENNILKYITVAATVITALVLVNRYGL